MQEIRAPGYLAPIQPAAPGQVHPRAVDLPLNNPRVSARLIEVLYVGERGAHGAANEECGVLTLNQFFGFLALAGYAEVPYVALVVGAREVEGET